MKTLSYLVITAAGQGTRMKAVNPNLPKEMLDVGGKPAIQYSVEDGISAQIDVITIVINRDKEIIREYFENEHLVRDMYPQAVESVKRINALCDIRFAYQDQPRGEVDAIYQTKEVVGDNPFAVIYPDDFHSPPDVALRTVSEAFNDYQSNIIALTVVSKDNEPFIGNSGKVKIKKLAGNVYQILDFIPKTKGRFTLRFEREIRTCGMMVFCGNVFRYIDNLRERTESKEFTDIHLLKEMMKENIILGCKLESDFFDIGNPVGYKKCLNHIQS